MRESLKCSVPECGRELTNEKFVTEEAATRSNRHLAKHPDGTSRRSRAKKAGVVSRVFEGMCPVHGRVFAERRGNHLTAKIPVGIVVDEEWQAVAFEIMRTIERPATTEYDVSTNPHKALFFLDWVIARLIALRKR